MPPLTRTCPICPSPLLRPPPPPLPPPSPPPRACAVDAGSTISTSAAQWPTSNVHIVVYIGASIMIFGVLLTLVLAIVAVACGGEGRARRPHGGRVAEEPAQASPVHQQQQQYQTQQQQKQYEADAWARNGGGGKQQYHVEQSRGSRQAWSG